MKQDCMLHRYRIRSQGIYIAHYLYKTCQRFSYILFLFKTKLALTARF